jgi:hypothetical protein
MGYAGTEALGIRYVGSLVRLREVRRPARQARNAGRDGGRRRGVV